MESIGFLAKEIQANMSPQCNMFEYLLVMDPDNIGLKGIDFVMTSLEGDMKLQNDYIMPKSSVELWKQFRYYFKE